MWLPKSISELVLPPYIEYVDDQFVVATGDAVHVLHNESLVPLIESINVVEMRGDFVLTTQHIVRLGGTAITLPPFDGSARPQTFVPVPDGTVVAVHDLDEPAAAAVLRLDSAGNVVWNTRTPPPATLAGYVSEARREDNFAIMPARPWVPREWMIHKRHLCVSHDRLLAIFAEIMRSGIGAGYGIDLGTGEVIYQTSPAPYHEVAPAAGAGRFLVGIQGYDAFETRLVDRDGNVITTWPSHGIVLAGDALRVIELENVIPSRCHVSTLRADGTVHHGVHLPGYYTSPVIVGADGSVVFWRDDAVMCVSPDGERLERLLTTPVHGRAHALAFAGRAPGRVVLSWSSTVEEHGMRMSYSKLMVIDVES